MFRFLRGTASASILLLSCLMSAHFNVAWAEEWCIRKSAGGAGCEISRAVDKTITYRLPNQYSLVMSNLSDGNQRVKIFHQGNQLQEFIAGMPNVPLGTIIAPLTQPFTLYGVLTARPDGIFEFGTGSSRSFYLPVNGGVMLIPLESRYMTLWLLGGNTSREYSQLSELVQGRIKRIEKYLGIAPGGARLDSNYFQEVESESATLRSTAGVDGGQGSPNCCCGGSGKKTLILGMGGRGSEDGAPVEEAFNGLDEHDKECTEFRRYPYRPETCAKQVAERLAMERDAEARSGEWCKVSTAAHSQAGIIASYAAAAAETRGLETHTMGSPLQGAYAGLGISMGALWTAGYFFPPGGSLLVDLAADCMFKEAASSHEYPSLYTSYLGERLGQWASVTTHTHEPTAMFPLSTQTGGPEGSTSMHHPGTDHVSVVNAALKSISSNESCTKCGDGVVDGAEECEGEGTSCTTSGGAAGKCTSKCKCESLCGNGTLDPGEECDTPGNDEICLCSFNGMHKVQCTPSCKIPGCDHPADPTPTPTRTPTQTPSPSPSPTPGPSVYPADVVGSSKLQSDSRAVDSAPPRGLAGALQRYLVEF